MIEKRHTDDLSYVGRHRTLIVDTYGSKYFCELANFARGTGIVRTDSGGRSSS